MKKNFVFSTLLVLSSAMIIFGQGAGYTNNLADQTLRSTGRVNPATLGMEIQIPLGHYPGRGLSLPISLSYSSKLWRMRHAGSIPTLNNPNQCHPTSTPVFSENSASGWTSGSSIPYIEYTGKDNRYTENGFALDDGFMVCGETIYNSANYVRRIQVHLPSGESHELRADDVVVSYDPTNTGPDPLNINLQANWNTTFYAVDGSNLRYVEDSTTTPATYRLLMPDGSHLDFSGSTVALPNGGTYGVRMATTLSDVNANTITYHQPTTLYPNGYMTDSLGRTIPIPVGLKAPNDPTPTVSPQEYKIPGFGGSENFITYKLHWKKLKDTTEAESALTNYSQSLCYKAYGYPYPSTNEPQPPAESCKLFGSAAVAWAFAVPVVEFNPVVLTQIELPNGASYKFTYDLYGRIDHIIYPTGGSEYMIYGVVPSLNPSGSIPGNDIDAQANFGVIERDVKESPAAPAMVWTYNSTGSSTTITAPDGTRTERLMLTGNAICTGCEVGTFGFDTPLAGMAYEERSYTAGTPGNLISKTITTWTSTKLAVTEPAGMSTTGDWHPRAIKTESIIYDSSTGSALSSTSTTDYEGNLDLIATALNPKTIKQYGFTTTVGGLGVLEKSSEIDYYEHPDYLALNLRSLPVETRIKDAGGNVKAKSQISYDQSGYGSGGVRGQVTLNRSWTDITNNLYIETKAKYDTYGNVIESTDARGNVTTTAYDSTHHAYPVSVTTPIPDTSGTYGSNAAFTTSVSYDYSTGLPLTSTDANGVVMKMEYDDPLLRPTKVTTAYGTALAAETITEYGAGTSPSTRWVKAKSQIDATNWKEGISWFDGLGRNIRSQSVDAESGDVFTMTCYDSVGRVSKATNPFRGYSAQTCASTSGLEWTTNTYDTAGRPWKVTTPDTAFVETNYSLATTGSQIGTTVTVADQAGKLRRSITNALGQLTRVDEPNGSNVLGSVSSPNQATVYSYNTIGKMVRVQQGDQNRYFLYDSLGRTLRISQPEQEVNTALNTSGNPDNNSWTGGFTYDNNGNVLTTKDAENKTITSTYDALNRPLARIYSDGTPTVTNYYDGAGLSSVPNYSKGKLTKVGSSVSESRYSSFDLTGRLLQSQQVTDGQTYTSAYQYNLSGALIEETYPSGRVVKNELDASGDLSMITSQKGGASVYIPYASNFSYSAAGAVTSMRLGNGKWETTKFNSRLQPIQMGLGASSTDAGLWKVNFEFGELQINGSVDATLNTGNIGKQTLTIPGTNFVQAYKYDPLNRLIEAQEKTGSTQNWIQNFGYDRFGNRTSFSQAIGGITTSTTPGTVATTNRFSSGQGFAYDKNGNVVNDVDPITSHSREFIFNGDNKQTQVKDVTNSNHVVGTYYYDGEGKRVKKVTDSETTIFVYSLGRIVAEYSTQLSTAPSVNYTTSDHLGSPRIITNELAQVKARRDFMPFGEEIYINVGGRTTSLNYGTSDDNVRQKFTGYQKDTETSLNFAEARMYENRFARFTSVDPLIASGKLSDPQTFNRYPYVVNRPLVMVDPTGTIGDFYDRDGNWIRSDGKNDKKVWLSVGGENYLLAITIGVFRTISNIIRKEGTSRRAKEYLWFAHAANNQAGFLRTSMSSVLMSSWSSVKKSEKTELSDGDKSTEATLARAGVLDVLAGGSDPTDGARFFDGTDFLAWGLNSPNGTPHNKFEEYSKVVINRGILEDFTASQMEKYPSGTVGYDRTRYTIPADVFKDPNKFTTSNFQYFTGVSNKGTLKATGAAGQSIFWKVVPPQK